MLIVPEREIADLMTREAAFNAVESVFAAMASGDAYNFPVIREAIGHEDALYGFKGGFDQAGLTLGLKAGGLHGALQSSVVPFNVWSFLYLLRERKNFESAMKTNFEHSGDENG